MDGQHLQPSSVVHLNTDTRMLEYADSIVMGNHEESIGIREISTNYSETRVSYDRKTTVVDTFSPNKLHMTFTMIQIQRPWQNVASAWTGPNGRMQFNRS